VANSGKGNELNERQHAAIAALLSCATVKAAAIKARVAYRTLRGWLDQDGFRAALRRAESTRLDEVSRRMLTLMSIAADTLEAGMAGTAKTSQVHAADATMKRFAELRELYSFEERLSALEGRANGKPNN
jgi:hypothetical protein